MAVNLSPYGGVGAQFLDNAGNVLTGGKIFTYAAGTTTSQATYTTSAGNIFHPNPIILDASGRVPNGGEIWLFDTLTYKFVLETSSGVLIATYDNIAGINSNSLSFIVAEEIQVATAGQTIFNLTSIAYTPGTNNLQVFVDGINQYDGTTYNYVETNSNTVTFLSGLTAGADVKFTTSQLNSGAGQNAAQTAFTGFKGQVGTVQDLADNDGSDWIGFQQIGANVVARSAQDKMRDVVSIKDFGAVGDGTTDNSAAIQAAHDSLPSTGGVIYFPPGGFWRVASTINITKSGVTLLGQGQGSASIIYVTSQTFNIFNISGGNFTAQNISFSVVSAVSGYALFITGDSAYVTNVFSLGTASFLYHSGGGLTVDAVNVSNSKIGTGIGIDLRDANANSVVILSNSTFSNQASAITQAFAGVYATEFGCLQIANCNFLAMGTGLYVNPGNGQSAVGIQITNVFFDNCNQGAYLITSGTGGIPQGCFTNCWFGSSYVGSGIFMQGTSTGLVQGFAISNCQIVANAGDGITLANSYVKDINITSNLIYANANGINVYPNVNNFLISGNQIGDVIGAGNTNYGIQIQTGTSNKYIITSNYLQGNGVLNLRDLGTGVDKVVANNLS